MLKYSALYYDERLLLKVSPLLWLSILYAIRHFFIVGAAVLMPLDIVSIPWLNLQANAYLILTDIPAVLVLLAIGHRISSGLKFMRRVWMHGRWLLIASYVTAIAAFTYVNKEIMTDPSSWDFPDGTLVLIIDLAFAGYLIGSGLVRDIFKDFPELTESLKK